MSSTARSPGSAPRQLSVAPPIFRQLDYAATAEAIAALGRLLEASEHGRAA